MLGNIDAVHGLYYLLMHGWFAVFPATEFWSRLSSSLAVGIAAAGVVVLGKQLVDPPGRGHGGRGVRPPPPRDVGRHRDCVRTR